MLEQTLIKQGLNAKDASVYLALLKFGQATVTALAEEAKINRTTTYVILKRLLDAGYATKVVGVKMSFSPVNPKKILAEQRSKLESLEYALPSLLGLANQQEQKPSVRFFTGKAGIQAIYEESLMLPNGSEILAIGNAQAVEAKIPRFRDWYIKRRVKQGIKMRAITPSTPGSLAVAGRDKLELRTTRLLHPAQFTEQVELNIYQNKVSMISLVDNEIIGMITESAVFANAHRQMFEILWHSAKPHK